MIKTLLISTITALALLTATPASAADYVIDTKKAHASILFKISHLGYSWLYGRFNTFHGEYSYDKENPAASKVSVEIDTASIDSNHAERDKHLRSEDFLDVKKYPKAKFTSTRFIDNGDGTGVLQGDFTLHGVTNPLSINVKYVGAGNDPWGGYRTGFEGSTKLALKDYGIRYDLGPASAEVELILNVEGIRK